MIGNECDTLHLVTRDVLIVLNPRRIAECIAAIGELPIDRLWLSNMTEREIQDQWGQILPHLDRYERAFIISDDACPRPHALKLLRGLMDDGHPVVTGYCNLAADDFRANLTYTPLRIPISTRSYDLYTIAQVMESQTITVPTFYTGFCLTGMSTELWRKYPYMVETEGADHMAADFNLSRRLEADGVPIVAHREAFIWHVKERWSENDQEDRKKLLIGVEPPAIWMEPLA